MTTQTEGPETIILPGRMLTTLQQDQPNTRIIVCDRLKVDFWNGGILQITIERDGYQWREYVRNWCEVRYPKRKIEAEKKPGLGDAGLPVVKE